MLVGVLGSVSLSALLVVAAAHPASAHAELLATDPEAGQVMSASPGRATLTFSEPIEGALVTATLKVGSADARKVPAIANGRRVQVEFPPGLPGGTWRVAYRVVSADSHPITGTFAFEVRTPSSPSPTGGAELTRTPDPLPSGLDQDKRASSDRGGPGVAGPWALVGGLALLVAAVILFVARPRRR